MSFNLKDCLASTISQAMHKQEIENEKNQTVEFSSAYIAESILAEGWVKPPCKIGETVYSIDLAGNIEECKVCGITFLGNDRFQLYVDDGEFKYITDCWFNSKEEAEKELIQRRKKDA